MWQFVGLTFRFTPSDYIKGNNIAVGTKQSCHTYQPIIQQIVVDGSWHPRDRTTTPSWPHHNALMTAPQHPHDRTTTPSWPHHNTLVTVPQHPRDLTTTPSWPHHKGLLKPSPTLPLVARKARNFPHRETFRLEDSSQLPPFFCNETSHLATKLLPKRVGMLKFRTTNKCTKYRKKHRKRG